VQFLWSQSCLISFNGNFVRSANESQLEALIRLLSAALTLIDPSDSSKYSFSGQQALLTHIERSAGERPVVLLIFEYLNFFFVKSCINVTNFYDSESPVVLLIDELNVLSSGMPLDSDASQFLKRYFLDMKQRYLVFTSHILLDLDQVSSLFIIPLYSDHVFYLLPLDFLWCLLAEHAVSAESVWLHLCASASKHKSSLSASDVERMRGPHTGRNCHLRGYSISHFFL
jgi:hypothetical protein